MLKASSDQLVWTWVSPKYSPRFEFFVCARAGTASENRVLWGPRSLHLRSQVGQRPVECLDPCPPQAWKFEIENGGNGGHDHDHEADHMEPAARLAGGHAVAREQSAHQREDEHDDENTQWRMELSGHGRRRRRCRTSRSRRAKAPWGRRVQRRPEPPPAPLSRFPPAMRSPW